MLDHQSQESKDHLLPLKKRVIKANEKVLIEVEDGLVIVVSHLSVVLKC